jgi:dihydrofolate reductase/uncharacterized protein YndB with AHSA1/START domain
MTTMTKPTTISAPEGTPFVDVERDFDASPAQVFRASTEPDLVARWLVPRELEMRLIEYDARPGGRYRYVHTDREGHEYGFRGVFHTVDQSRLIVQTFEYEGAPGMVSLESTTFEDLGGGTRLRTRTVFPSVESRDMFVASGMEHGVRDAMDQLAEVSRQAETEAETAGATAGERPSGVVMVDITMSLDGYVTAPGAGPDNGLGVGGKVLHTWAMGENTERDAEIIAETFGRTGAVIMGRRTYDVVDGPNGWGDERSYGGRMSVATVPPVFVVTHTAPEPDSVRLKDRFVFVTDGLESALAQARVAAGDKDVIIMGGGAIANAFLRAGLVDVLSLHVAPVVLGAGTPLFPPVEGDGTTGRLLLELTGSVSTPAAQHVTYRVLKEIKEVDGD